MVWTPADIPDQRGRVAVVTGPTSGLGLAAARELARAGAHVVLAGRDERKLEATGAAIEESVPGAQLEHRLLDLESLDAVRACAAELLDAHDRVDLLVNNAGVMGVAEQATADGFELQLGVNHLGHFALTRRLLPALLAASAGRIVSVTSWGRIIGRPLDPDNPHLRGRYDPWLAYAQAKLANLHFAWALQQRLEAAGTTLRSVAAQPGLAPTGLQARSVEDTGGGVTQRFFHWLANAVGMPTDVAAHVLLRAATDPQTTGHELYAPRWVIVGDPVRRRLLRRPPVSALEKLWAVSERETGERFEIRAQRA